MYIKEIRFPPNSTYLLGLQADDMMSSCQGSQALKVVKLSSQKLSCQSSQPAKQSIASIVHICTCYMNNVFIIILFNGGKMKANVREQ